MTDEIGFTWKDDGALTFKPDDKLWRQQHEKLLEHKGKNGHCKVPSQTKKETDCRLHEEDSNSSSVTSNALTGPDEEVVQEEATPESGQMTARTNPRGNATGSCSSVEEDGGRDENDIKPSLVTGSAAPAQTKRLFKKKQHCSKADKWLLLGQTKEAVRLQVAVVLWRKMEVLAMKKI
mgnify:CR=1 FL=1